LDTITPKGFAASIRIFELCGEVEAAEEKPATATAGP
jgi:hypothetical protein